MRAFLLLALTLAGCARPGNPDICSTPEPLSAAPPKLGYFDQLKIADGCVHRWSYRLSIAAGDNREIADAAVAACEEPIDGLNELWAVFRSNDANLPAAPFQSVQDLRDRFRRQALFHVIQARAGRCKIP